MIANHFVEHCADPIGTLKNLVRVVRPGGILYIALPDKRYTFDAPRPSTPFEHLVRDHDEGPEWSRRGHFEEWAKYVEPIEVPNRPRRSADELEAIDYSVHFHVWQQSEMLQMICNLQTRFGLPFDIELCAKNGMEVIIVLRKHAPEPHT